MTPDQGTLHSVGSATEFNPCGRRAARIKAHVGRSIAGWRDDVVADEKRATNEKESKKTRQKLQASVFQELHREEPKTISASCRVSNC